MGLRPVRSQQVLAEIALNVPPDGVHVVGAVLRVVVLHQERAALDPIVMGPVAPLFARPGR